MNPSPPQTTDNPSPSLGASSQQVTDTLIANSQLPITDPPHHHFPFMMVTLFLAVILAGFIGSYLFFSFSSNPTSFKPPSILVPPTATTALPSLTIVPTISIATVSSDLTTVPSASHAADITPTASSSPSAIPAP